MQVPERKRSEEADNPAQRVNGEEEESEQEREGDAQISAACGKDTKNNSRLEEKVSSYQLAVCLFLVGRTNKDHKY